MNLTQLTSAAILALALVGSFAVVLTHTDNFAAVSPLIFGVVGAAAGISFPSGPKPPVSP